MSVAKVDNFTLFKFDPLYESSVRSGDQEISYGKTPIKSNFSDPPSPEYGYNCKNFSFQSMSTNKVSAQEHLDMENFTGVTESSDSEKVYYLDGHQVSERTYLLMNPEPEETKDVLHSTSLIEKPKKKISLVIKDEKQESKTDSKMLILTINKSYLNSCSQECSIVNSRFAGGFSKHVMPKGPTKSIIPDLKNYQIDVLVASKAEEIYRKFKIPTKRGRNRKLLLLMCVYYAKMELGTPENIRDVGKIFGLNNKDISAAKSQFSREKTGYSPPNLFVKPSYFVKQYFNKISLSPEKMNDVIKMCNSIVAKDSSLEKVFPSHVAIAVIFFYSHINGIELDKKKVTTDLLNRSYATIQQTYSKVEIAYNK